MSDKVRVYDLARELGLTPKELIAMLEKEGFTVKSHSSTLEADIADLIRDAVITSRQKKQAAASQAATSATAAPKEKPAKEAPKAKPAAEKAEKAEKPAPQQPKEEAPAEPPAEKPELHLKTPITVGALAEGLGKKPNELIFTLMSMNIHAKTTSRNRPNRPKKANIQWSPARRSSASWGTLTMAKPPCRTTSAIRM